MLILGLESSCDETAAAVVRDGRDVLSNVIASQDNLHAEYGGVVPEIASRAHAERILPVVRRALGKANVALDDIDAIAVGNRPGLIGSLLVGVASAKALAWSLRKPLIGVDHIHAHLYAAALDREPPDFPALGLVVSGGHTNLYRLESWLDIERLGATIDDAVGEAYDKVATILGLEYPGGPRLDKLAHSGDENAHNFPVSELGTESLDFSFSGVKTSVLYTVCGKPRGRGADRAFERDHTALTEQQKADIAASFQKAATDALLLKLDRAFDKAPLPLGEGFGKRDNSSPSPPGRGVGERDSVSYRTLLVGGGVSANSRLRAELPALADRRGLDLRIPPIRYCLDNAAMIAGLAHQKLAAGLTDDLTLPAVATVSR